MKGPIIDLVVSKLFKDMDLFGVSIVLPLISSHARELGASPTVTGVIGSLYGFLQFFSSPVVGRWSDISGRRYCLIWCLILSAGSYALLGIASSPFLMFISRIPGGIFKHSQTISKSLLTDIVPDNQLSRALGYFNAASSIGFILGPLIGGHIAETPGGFYKVALLAGAIFLLNSVIVWYSFSVLVFRTNFTLTMKERFETSPKINGYIISYTGTISALFGFTAGSVSNFYKNDAKLITHLAILQVITLLFLSYTFSLNLFILWLTPLSFGSTLLRVVSARLLFVRGKGKDVGTLMGFSQSNVSIARIISPFLSGLALEFSASGPSLIGALTTMIAIVVLVIRPQNPQFD
ncbi:hypothetical protein KUTeg_007542 [Tegillarca granosa]|uniref:Major facilitator superfamily (MFS) profile domain-containing protein n=1 Tax=Tegillarca granosa TaxID=220873 RepID=A0ABQ9FFV0_TEGGR|nr:hypothetical protein KUTeg_007542 [Tegillarca granosa]